MKTSSASRSILHKSHGKYHISYLRLAKQTDSNTTGPEALLMVPFVLLFNVAYCLDSKITSHEKDVVLRIVNQDAAQPQMQPQL